MPVATCMVQYWASLPDAELELTPRSRETMLCVDAPQAAVLVETVIVALDAGCFRKAGFFLHQVCLRVQMSALSLLAPHLLIVLPHTCSGISRLFFAASDRDICGCVLGYTSVVRTSRGSRLSSNG